MHSADNEALETQQPTNAADKSAFSVIQSTDGDRHLWETVRDRNGTEQHYPRHRGESRRRWVNTRPFITKEIIFFSKVIKRERIVNAAHRQRCHSTLTFENNFPFISEPDIRHFAATSQDPTTQQWSDKNLRNCNRSQFKRWRISISFHKRKASWKCEFH